jgi:hypothetical protein
VPCARDLASGYALRGCDAVQFASALALEGPDVVSVTWDDDLDAACTTGTLLANDRG